MPSLRDAADAARDAIREWEEAVLLAYDKSTSAQNLATYKCESVCFPTAVAALAWCKAREWK